MKRKLLVLAAVAVAGVLVLTACTSSENQSVQNQGSQSSSGGAANNTGSDSQGTVSGQEVSGSQVVSGSTVNSNAGSDTGVASDTIPQGAPVEDGGPVGEVIPDEDAQAAENDTEGASDDGADAEDDDDGAASAQNNPDDIWSGVYEAEEESVTINYIDTGSITFSFAHSGISGTAVVNGHQAVYYGDDHYVVVFNVNNDVVDVSVSSEEDYDASGSPLIGAYTKKD